MELISNSFEDGAAIPVDHAFGAPDPDNHVTFAPNRNPHLAWTDVPEGTASFVVICHDPDSPSAPDDVNQVDREIPEDLPRVDFVHWVLVDLPADARGLEAGVFSDGVTPRGKSQVDGPLGARTGVNDYTDWFAEDAEMAGTYRGYDGPCPPWNDSIVHRYIFTVYAVDVPGIPVDGDFGASDVVAAMAGHALGHATITGTYTLNPRLIGT